MTHSVTYPIDSPMNLEQFLLSLEREALLNAVKECHFNASKAARKLGISFRSMRYRLEKSGFTLRTEPKRVRNVNHEFERAWPKLRMATLKRYGARCQCCGATAKDVRTIHVDHILPRKTHPHLALEPANLQVLCEPCNLSKSFIYQDDWR